MTEPTDKQRRMAARMNLHPDKPDTWPMETIERFIWLEENRSRIDFDLEWYDQFTRRLDTKEEPTLLQTLLQSQREEIARLRAALQHIHDYGYVNGSDYDMVRKVLGLDQ